MNNGLPGAPSTTDTVTGGKTLEMSDYDKIRQPHKAITDGTKIRMNTRTLSSELCCPICLDLLTSTMTTKECLHRFCSECITTALMRGNKECPTCRKKIVSKRSLRPDPNFDFLISKIWPDRKQYEDMQEAALKLYREQNSVEALQRSIEAGMKAQAANRRQRVQGSYDYEKRKRRPKLDPNGSNGSNNNTSTLSNSQGNCSTSSINMSRDSNSPSPLLQDVEMSDISIDHTLSSPAAATNNINASRNGPLSSTSDASESSSSDLSSDTLSETSDTSASTSSQSEATNHSDLSSLATKEDPAGAAVLKPPSSYCTLNDKMSRWLEANHNSPLTPDVEDCMEGDACSSSVDSRLEEMRKKGEEIEVELVPAKSLLRRGVSLEGAGATPASLLASRYVKAPPDITMQHLCEYLYQSCLTEEQRLEDQESAPGTSDTTLNIAKPEHFYILDHNQQLRRIFPHETLFSAFIGSMFTEEHLMLFFDNCSPNTPEKLVAEAVISDEILARLPTAGCSKMSVAEAEAAGSSKSFEKSNEKDGNSSGMEIGD